MENSTTSQERIKSMGREKTSPRK